MTGYIKELLELKRLPASIVLLVGVISGLLLFSPHFFLLKLYLDDFKREYNKYIGVVFLCCLGLLIMIVIKWCFNSINYKRQLHRHKKKVKKMVLNLDWEEVNVLRLFYITPATTIKVPIDNPVVAGLIQKGLISQVGRFGKNTLWGMFFSFKISEAAKECITSDVLRFPDRELTMDEQRAVLEERPQWIKEIESRNWV